MESASKNFNLEGCVLIIVQYQICYYISTFWNNHAKYSLALGLVFALSRSAVLKVCSAEPKGSEKLLKGFREKIWKLFIPSLFTIEMCEKNLFNTPVSDIWEDLKYLIQFFKYIKIWLGYCFNSKFYSKYTKKKQLGFRKNLYVFQGLRNWKYLRTLF